MVHFLLASEEPNELMKSEKTTRQAMQIKESNR